MLRLHRNKSRVLFSQWRNCGRHSSYLFFFASKKESFMTKIFGFNNTAIFAQNSRLKRLTTYAICGFFVYPLARKNTSGMISISKSLLNTWNYYLD